MNEKQKPEDHEFGPKKSKRKAAALAALALTAGGVGAAGSYLNHHSSEAHQQDKIVTDQEVLRNLENLSVEDLVKNGATVSEGPIIETDVYGHPEKVGTLVIHYSQEDGDYADEVRGSNNKNIFIDWNTGLRVSHELAEEQQGLKQLSGKVLGEDGQDISGLMGNGAADLVVPLNPEFSGQRTVIVESLTEIFGHNLSQDNSLPQTVAEEKELARVTVNVDGEKVDIVPENSND